ncbi:MAG TPA: OpgC domain-containing protein [Stellaceae bacterium]|nr:OpgC domain-containing protein [Stellaceae bacterium]
MVDAPAKATRDLRLDFFRGLSLFFIFVDHIPENVLTYFTLHSVAFNDAAEVFIFISGYTAALVYGRSLAEKGALFATAQIYRRVWQLYVAHIFLFVIFTAEVSYAMLVLRNPLYSEEMRVASFLQEPHLAIIRTLLLAFQPMYLDILPLYIVLLATFPLVLIVMARQNVTPLLISAAIYALTLYRGWAFHTRPSHDVWFFNPLAWQFLFVIGATAGYARVTERWPFPRARWIGPAALVVAALIAIINITWTIHWIYGPFPPLLAKQLWSYSLDKTNLAPLRLFSFLVLALATVQIVRSENRFLRTAWARPVIVCGQQSLYIFCLGIVLSVLGHFLLAELSGGFVMQALVNLVGLGTMIAVAALLDWFKTASRRPYRAPPTVPTVLSE